MNGLPGRPFRTSCATWAKSQVASGHPDPATFLLPVLPIQAFPLLDLAFVLKLS